MIKQKNKKKKNLGTQTVLFLFTVSKSVLKAPDSMTKCLARITCASDQQDQLREYRVTIMFCKHRLMI